MLQEIEKPVISVSGLHKSYGKAKIVEEFSLNVQKGHICGLIGPNGAGKTTIMRIMAGLTAQDAGEVSYFGGGDMRDALHRTSFMIEAPIINMSMNARENLRYVRYVRGVASEKRIDEVLELVDLQDAGKKSAKLFSLGMKQRLGIAMALLTTPEILVLDEPVNGLDPEGIVEVRHMLKRLAEEQSVTIVISSHILSELSELCTDFTIINHGKLVDSFNSEELLTRCRNYLSIKTNDINRTAALLEQKLGIKEYKVVHDEELQLFEHLSDVENVSRTITEGGLTILRLAGEGSGLEDYYLSKVGGKND